MVAPATRPLNLFEVSVLGAGSHVWLSANSSQGSVYGVPRTAPVWALDGQSAPADWLSVAIRHAQREAGDQALQVGHQLSELIFGVPDVSSLFQQARGAAASAGEQLLLRLLVAPQEIGAWPWELLLDPQRPDQYLTLARDVHVVRAARSRTYPVRVQPVEPPLNLLMVMSSPLMSGSAEQESPFDLYEEKRSLLAELRPLVEKGLLRIEVEDRPTVERLHARIGRQQRGFHLLHYLGHAQPAGLKLELPNGLGDLISGERFARLLQQMPDLRLAVFAGCETARAPSDPAPQVWPGRLSVADYCVRDACPMVIGMQAVLPFGTERLFTRFFYQALTAGQPVADALRLARLAIIDDQDSGRPLVNWSVPALFVGGSLPGPIIDPAAKAEPQPRPTRIALRLDARQRDLRFISRLTQLREAIDVLSGDSAVRLLQVIGLPGTGKSSFLDRAMEELEPDVVLLSMSANRLAGEDGLGELCELVAELVRRNGGHPSAKHEFTSTEWWERLIEDLTDVKMALVIDDADPLVAAGSEPGSVLHALSQLTQRRSRVRVAVAAEEEISSLNQPLTTREVRRIRLEPLLWPEMWQWIRRNLPVLTRFPESELAGFYSDLSHLEQWEQLANVIAGMKIGPTPGDLPAIIENIAATVSTSASRPAAQPIFGAEESLATVAPESAPGAAPAPLRALKVAVAGPFTASREAQFSRAVTKFAAQWWVSGRVAASESVDSASSLGELLSLPSPFQDGSADSFTVAQWMQAAVEAAADVVVLDFGIPEPDGLLTTAVGTLLSLGCLVIASGGNDGAPSYPAWIKDVLAVGALDEDGQPAAYSPYFKKDRKPDLYAPKRLEPSLSSMVEDAEMEGTTTAALNATAAAIVVWASDRGLSAQEVRKVLLDTAHQRKRAGSVRVLDVEAALASTRRQLLLDSLQNEPLELSEILSETGLRPEVAVPLIEDLVASNALTRIRTGDVEKLEDPDSLAQRYTRLRSSAPGEERTRQLEQLVARAGDMARHGRYTREKVQNLWDSGHDGRRIVALGVIQARPDLGNPQMIAAGLSDSRSAFEVSQALAALLKMWPTIDHVGREQIRDAANTAFEKGMITGADRRQLTNELREPDERNETDDAGEPGQQP